jgi:hypothetical protein
MKCDFTNCRLSLECKEVYPCGYPPCATDSSCTQPTTTNNARDEIAALANELDDFNSTRVAPYERIAEIVAKMRQLSAVPQTL